MSLVGQGANLVGVHLEDAPGIGKFYNTLEEKLKASDPLVKLVLVGVIAVAIYLIIQPSRTRRLLGALYFALP